MGMQIAKLKGARLVMGSSTNAKRRERLAEFGADLAIDTTQKDWGDAVLKATDGKGVDLIVDQVSASVANENLRAAAVLGRIVNVGRLGGFKGEFDFDLHAMKRIDYIGVTFRTRSVGDQSRHARRPVATCREWQAEAADRPHLPSRSGPGRAGAHACQCALRQDRARHLMPAAVPARISQP
jgi:NADPH2:quinone reductase